MYESIMIGVLALQGDFACHLSQLDRLNVLGLEIRRESDIDKIDALIIPGGETTTMSMLIDRFSMRDKLSDFIKNKPVWGTCAGSILLADSVDDARIKPFGVMDISIRRNAYGRQVHSFYDEIDARLNGSVARLRASFIRAPIIDKVGDSVEILAENDGKPVLLRQDKCLISTFHTELHDDPMLTKYFIDEFVLNIADKKRN